jgi:hypothetical protein
MGETGALPLSAPWRLGPVTSRAPRFRVPGPSCVAQEFGRFRFARARRSSVMRAGTDHAPPGRSDLRGDAPPRSRRAARSRLSASPWPACEWPEPRGPRPTARPGPLEERRGRQRAARAYLARVQSRKIGPARPDGRFTFRRPGQENGRVSRTSAGKEAGRPNRCGPGGTPHVVFGRGSRRGPPPSSERVGEASTGP